MDTNKNVIKLIKIATILCFALCFSECAVLPNRTIVPTPSDDSPLPEFIHGQWQSINVTLSTSGVDDSKYRITFEDKNRVNYIISYPNSGDAEGYTFKYEFVTQDTIHIDNPRITGGENWRLEKSNGNLLITRYFPDNTTMALVLVRVR